MKLRSAMAAISLILAKVSFVIGKNQRVITYGLCFMRALLKRLWKLVFSCKLPAGVDASNLHFTHGRFAIFCLCRPNLRDMIGHGLQFLDGGYFLFHGLGFSLVPVRRVAFAGAVKRREKSCVKDLQACLREASLMLVFCWLRHQ